MEQQPERLGRPRVAALDEILGRAFPVLDDGFVRLVDYMGDDAAIVQAARVSYGAGTKHVSDDRGLIRYLMRHRHTTPFEMCELKLHVRVPMDAWRQWIRHRSACLAEGTEVYFDLRGGIRRRGNQLYKIKIEDLWQRFQPTRNTQRPDKQRNPYFKRDRLQRLPLRSVNEDTLAIGHTRLRNVYRNGPKPVFRLFLADGKCIEATADHRFLFQGGWKTLAQETGLRLAGDLAVWQAGDYFLHVNGQEVEVPALYQNKAWLNHRYNVEKSKIQDIAEECGVSYHTIRKWLREHNIQHEKGGRSKAPWNHGARYRLGPRVVTDSWRMANLRARAGSASNFWRGGVTADRANIGRWTTQMASRLHARNRWTCQLCGQRSGELRAHHIVPVWAEPTLALSEQNLTTLCAPCHRQVHLNELAYVEKLGGPPVKADWKKRPRVAWNKLTKTRLVRLEAITYVGMKETYDLEVEGPFHNFIANGIVTHNSVNEYSTRYSMAIDAAQRTPPHAWRKQAENNRQGSSGVLDAGAGAAFTKQEEELQEYARAVYQERLAAGIAREQARKDLPLATYTEAYWKIDLHNLLHFLSLRMEAHAQLEIRSYAETIGREIVARWVPLAWEAFVDYRLSALSLSRLESDILAALGAGDPARAVELATAAGWLARGDGGALKRHREREECEEKLGRLGQVVPWAS